MAQPLYASDLAKMIERQRVAMLESRDEEIESDHTYFCDGYLACLSFIDQWIEDRQAKG